MKTANKIFDFILFKIIFNPYLWLLCQYLNCTFFKKEVTEQDTIQYITFAVFCIVMELHKALKEIKEILTNIFR